MAVPKVPSSMIKSAEAAHTAAHGAKSGAGAVANVGNAGAVFNTLAPIESAVGTVSGLAIFGAFAAQLGGVKPVMWATKKLGATSAHSSLEHLQGELQKPLEAGAGAEGITKLGHFENVAFAASSAVSTYAVAKSFSAQLDSLKHAIADVKGIPVTDVSTMGALFGSVPESLKSARDHLLKEHAIRGLAQAVGLGAMLMAVRSKKQIGFLAIAVPGIVDMGANAFMGESILPIYASVKNAYIEGQKAGQGMPAEAYGQFLFAASPALHVRGELGQMVAVKVGEQYAAEKADPGAIMREMDSGKFMDRIKGLIAEADAMRAAQAEAAKHKAAAAKAAPTHSTPAHHAHGSMVARVTGTGEKPQRPVVGQHTQMVSEQVPATVSVT